MNVDINDVIKLLQSHVDEQDKDTRAMGLSNGLKYALRILKEQYGK